MSKVFGSKSWTALAAVTGCLAMSVMATPVGAKPKKEEPAKAQGPSASKGFFPSAKKMQDATAAKDAAALQAAITEGEAAATTPGDHYIVAQFKLQLGIINKDQALQGAALDALIDSGLAPQGDLAKFAYFSGNFAYGAKDYAKAIKRLEAAQAAGSTESNIGVLIMDSYLQTGDVDAGMVRAKAAIAAAEAAGQRPLEELFVRPALALQKVKRNDDVFDFLALRLKYYPTPETWRNTLYIELQQAGDDKDLNLDILRAMRYAEAMTKRPEYLEYAGLATEAGFPSEVVALVKEGQARGVIASGDASFNAILETQGPRASADLTVLRADAVKPATRANAKIALSTADALVGTADFALAIPLYQAALDASGGTNQSVLYRMGVAQALSGDRAGALATFGKVGGNRAHLARLWVIRLGNMAVTTPAAPAIADTPAG